MLAPFAIGMGFHKFVKITSTHSAQNCGLGKDMSGCRMVDTFTAGTILLVFHMTYVAEGTRKSSRYFPSLDSLAHIYLEPLQPLVVQA